MEIASVLTKQNKTINTLNNIRMETVCFKINGTPYLLFFSNPLFFYFDRGFTWIPHAEEDACYFGTHTLASSIGARILPISCFICYVHVCRSCGIFFL